MRGRRPRTSNFVQLLNHPITNRDDAGRFPKPRKNDDDDDCDREQKRRALRESRQGALDDEETRRALGLDKRLISNRTMDLVQA